MASTDPKPTKRRVGRRRNPPLPPPPAFQFVVANHPNDFKATQTLREVRSHVMYRHRENQGSSPTELDRSHEDSSAPGTLARTPSPVSIDSVDVLQTNALPESTTERGYITALCQDNFGSRTLSPSTDPVRDLAAQILSAVNPKPPHSAPPACEGASEYPFPGYNLLTSELSEDTKREWIRTTSFFCHDRIWMRSVCDSHLSFLSHVYTTLVYQDIDEGLLHDSDLTVFAKTMILRLISSRLDTDDATIICILHLLISEIGGTDEDVFNVHQDGLMTCLRNQQGGLNSSLAWSMAL
ncbi:hypothetical protein DDE82_000676 [Stemphylium lycopersici]|nr:hypothetical protein DDE82_000676 [Stemphylium lycopersici]